MIESIESRVYLPCLSMVEEKSAVIRLLEGRGGVPPRVLRPQVEAGYRKRIDVLTKLPNTPKAEHSVFAFPLPICSVYFPWTTSSGETRIYPLKPGKCVPAFLAGLLAFNAC